MSAPPPDTAAVALRADDVIAPPHISALRLARSKGAIRGRLALLGPAFVAAVAYIDPGNFATNITGGAKYGYLLVWVIIAANLMAMLVQYLSAKVGVATGRNLPELARDALPRPVTWGLWVQAEIIAIATDLAEFVGAAIALNLLFGVPPFTAGLMTAVVAFAILALQTRGYRRFELAIAALLGIVLLGFLYDLLQVGVDGPAFVSGMVPHFDGTESILIAVGILGATVMPHVVYLHSALTQSRIKAENDDERRELMRFQRADVMIAMGLAGVINLTMLVVAAQLFHDSGHTLDRLDRGRPRRAQHAARRRRRARLRGRAAGLRAVELERRHVRRPGRDAGLHQLPHPALPAPRDHHDARADRARERRQHDRHARALAGRPELRHPVRARADDPADPPRRPDGRARQPQAHHRDRLDRGGDDHRPEHLPAVGDVHLS